MATYVVVAEVTVSIRTEVEAESPEKAMEIAEGREMSRLCHHCATGEPEKEWVASELDGSPEKIRIGD
jgi:hypothetical protein